MHRPLFVVLSCVKREAFLGLARHLGFYDLPRFMRPFQTVTLTSRAVHQPPR